MSLLMDALKKAEQEKREAALRQQESKKGGASARGAKAQKGLDDTWEHETLASGGATRSPDTTLRSTTAELSLEPMPGHDLEIDKTAELHVSESVSEDPTLNVTMNELALSEMSSDNMELDDQSFGDDETVVADMDADKPETYLDETMHSPELGNETAELFKETLQGEAYIPGVDGTTHSYEETLPGVPAAQLVKDIGGGDDQPTPVAAQTVFTATGTMQHSTIGFKSMLAGICIVTILSSYWYFKTVVPTNRKLPSPLVAAGVESILPQALQAEMTVGEPMYGSLSGGPQSEFAEAAAVEETSIVAASNTEPAGEAALPAISEAPENVTTTDNQEAVADVAMTGDTDTGIDYVVADSVLPSVIDPEPSLIRISRSTSSESQGLLVNTAFAAYQAGDYQNARSGYEEVLKHYPDNSDALLGLAAMAMNKGDLQEAASIYLRLLRLNPRNEIARAVLIGLQDGTNAMDSESAVKSMIHENPESPFLHFTLGNIYASQYRWAEAQQAFFDAYTHDSGNPDYALNLAVSLDHMGQKNTALDYYHTAMKLADERVSSFDVTPVMTRIQSLSSVVTSP